MNVFKRSLEQHNTLIINKLPSIILFKLILKKNTKQQKKEQLFIKLLHNLFQHIN